MGWTVSQITIVGVPKSLLPLGATSRVGGKNGLNNILGYRVIGFSPEQFDCVVNDKEMRVATKVNFMGTCGQGSTLRPLWTLLETE